MQRHNFAQSCLRSRPILTGPASPAQPGSVTTRIPGNETSAPAGNLLERAGCGTGEPGVRSFRTPLPAAFGVKQ